MHIRLRSLLALLMVGTFLLSAAEVPRRAGEFVFDYPALSKQELLSLNLQGKKCTMIAFLQTTCPHCQKLAALLAEMKREAGANGFQPFIVAYDPNAEKYAKRFQELFCPDIPVAVSTREIVHPYLQLSLDGPSYVPKLVVIDGKGMIREQYSGGDPYFNPSQEKANLRLSIAKYLK